MTEAEIAVEVEALTKKINDELDARGYGNDSRTYIELAREKNNVDLLRLLAQDWVIDEYLFSSVFLVHSVFETHGYHNASRWVTKNRVAGYEDIHFAVQKICHYDRDIDGGSVLTAALMSEYADDVQGTEYMVAVIKERTPSDREELLSMLPPFSELNSVSSAMWSGVL